MHGRPLSVAFALSLAAATLAQGTVQIQDVAVSPDSKHLAVTVGRDRVFVYRLASGALVKTLRHRGKARLIDLEFSPDGRFMAVSNHDYTGAHSPIFEVRGWKPAAKIALWHTAGKGEPAGGFEYLARGKWLVGPPLRTPTLVCWDATSGRTEYFARSLASGRFRFATSPTSTLVALVEVGSNQLRFWDVAGSRSYRRWGQVLTGVDLSNLYGLRFSPDGQRLLLVGQGRSGPIELAVCRPINGKTAAVGGVRVDGLRLRDFEWSPDNRTAYLVGLGGQIAAVDLGASRVIAQWRGHGGAHVKAVTTGQNGRLLVTGAGKTVCLWDAKTRKLLRTIRVPA